MSESNIPHQDITYKIIGAAMRVHNRMARGLKEKHYQRALQAEMLKDGLCSQMEYHLEIYDGQIWLGRLYLDHWVNECVVVEDKAVSRTMGDKELAQVREQRDFVKTSAIVKPIHRDKEIKTTLDIV